MKKIVLLFACAAAALMFASCGKQDIQAVSKDDPQGPPAEFAGDGFQTISAIAPATKTTASGVDVLWQANDVIGLYCGIPVGDTETTASATFTTSVSSPSATAEFAKSDDNVPEKIGDYYIAAYPTSGIQRWYYSENGQEHRLYFSFFKEQTAVKGGWDSRQGAMVAKSTDNNFSFQHCSAFIKFTVGASSPAFKSVKVAAKGGTDIINRLKVVISGDNLLHYEVATFAALKSSDVMLSTSDGNAFEPGTYYISILPVRYPEGFEFCFENAAGQIAKVSKAGDFTFAGGDVADLGTIGALDFKVPAAPLELATVFEENGKKQGVVYWIDPSDPYKGKIVSVCTPDQIVWATQTYNSDATGGNLGGTDTNDGLANFNTVTNYAAYQENPANFPAMKYCADLRTSLGGNWYLPVASELSTLFKAYYGLSVSSLTNNTDYRLENNVPIQSVMDTKAGYDAALRLLGETTSATLDGDADGDGVSDNAGFGTANGVQYWSSKVNSNGNTQYVRFGNYTLTNGTKTTAKYVRCIRDVESK